MGVRVPPSAPSDHSSARPDSPTSLTTPLTHHTAFGTLRAALVLSLALLLSSGAPAEAGRWHREYATWYGPGFYGKRTSCGQRYTRWLAGVAHRTLPCGTRIQVRFRGRTVTVPVIDRGPWGVPWSLDLSAFTSCWQLTGWHPRNCASKWVSWRVVR